MDAQHSESSSDRDDLEDEEWTPVQPPSVSVDGQTEASVRFAFQPAASNNFLSQQDSWDSLRHGESEDADNEGNVAVPDIKDTHRSRMRKRIRRRDGTIVNTEQFRDDINNALQFEDEPLVAKEDHDAARRSAWCPEGRNVPDLFDIEMGYHKAWDIGKKGCVAVKLNGLWDTQFGPSKNRFFLMDGTDPDRFLNFYTKSDLQAARGAVSEKQGTIGAYDLRDGYWDYKRCKVYIQRSDHDSKDAVLDKLSREFMDAMLICIWEMEVRTYLERLKVQRLEQRRQAKTSPTTKNSKVGGHSSA
eukprot:GHVS01042850.1.p1 GENE.GHVS01042850.1~~GHVS01042850.1.p1  ORF type:complete len:302 (+),score=41.45 GHVS01042850.1:115-1020(+)